MQVDDWSVSLVRHTTFTYNIAFLVWPSDGVDFIITPLLLCFVLLFYSLLCLIGVMKK